MNAYQLIEKAREALARETRIDLRFAPIEVDIAGDAVRLHGEVEGIETKRVAVDALKAAPDLPGVVDELRVHPAVPQGDSAVRDEVYTRLTQDPAFAHVSVSCRIEGGEHLLARPSSRPRGVIEATISGAVVTLRGHVPGLTEKCYATLLAWKNAGVRDVVNRLEVADASEGRDGAMRAAIERLCRRNALLHEQAIEVSVGDGVVRLRGVARAGASRLIQHDAWYLDGVRDVINDIEPA